MNEQELKSQRTKAQANYQLKQLYQRAGKATPEEVEQARRIWEALKEYKPGPADGWPATAVTVATAESTAIPIPAMAVDEFARLIEDLTIERHEALKQMCLRSNRLADFPDDQNVKDLVDEIQEWKAKRNAVAEKIAYVRLNGRLPVDTGPAEERSPEATKSAFLANLPADRYELNKLLVNSLQPKLYRFKKSLAGAKSEIWIAHYRKEVAKAQAEVDLVKSQISALA